MLTRYPDSKHKQTASLKWHVSSRVDLRQDVDEDMELGPFPDSEEPTSPDNPDKSSQDNCNPVEADHIRWALEDGARRKGKMPLQQKPHGDSFALQQTGDQASKSHEIESDLAVDMGTPAWNGQSGSQGVSRPSGEFDEEAVGSLEGGNTPPVIGKDSTAISREVSEDLEIGDPRRRSVSSLQTDQHVEMLPWLSRQVTVGRNSNFYGLSVKDREELGGIEYRSLKVLLKILIGRFL